MAGMQFCVSVTTSLPCSLASPYRRGLKKPPTRSLRCHGFTTQNYQAMSSKLVALEAKGIQSVTGLKAKAHRRPRAHESKEKKKKSVAG